MKIAIITGASAGLGRKLAECAADTFSDIDEFWLIARSEDKLQETALAIKPRSSRVIPLDLSSNAAYEELEAKLRSEQAQVVLLINNAGCGYLNDVGDGPVEEQIRMVDLNIRALTAITHLCIPYMPRGARIINISSIASFCPNPRMSVYSSSKAYVTSFSKSIGFELRKKGVSVTAVCPGPMATEFLDIGNIKGRSKTFETLPYCEAHKVAEGAIRASFKRQSVYTPRVFYKIYRVLAKLLPHDLMMIFSKT
ncbi:MAG: SDR family NAD(P)-dependent oxidoreductase [Oscillospiraceae bacterium]|nr:SDR family NAD(P)-dependent oxidoreductase [Oscillospiraceae bacterium]